MLVSNGTDLINRIRRRQVRPKTLVDLSGLSEFNYVKQDGSLIRIGALTTLDAVAGAEVLRDERYEVFRQVIDKFGAPNITNMATIGGNVCAASSSEDFLPVLLVLDAGVRLISKSATREMKLNDFLLGKRETALRPNEILSEVNFPVVPEKSWCAYDKVGMRNSLIIAFVNIALYLALNRVDKRVEAARLAFNRVRGKIPERASGTEKILVGKRVDKALVEEAVKTLSGELRLKSDFRVTGDYRVQVALTFFKRTLAYCLHRLGADVL
jgi:carbon-monoxide dehydrogenase medium subunit